MNSRSRYPPPGIGGPGGGRGAGHMHPNANPNFQPRNPPQYVQRGPMQFQTHQHPQQQQWLRRNQHGSDSTVDEVEKTIQPEAVDSRLFLCIYLFILKICAFLLVSLFDLFCFFTWLVLPLSFFSIFLHLPAENVIVCFTCWLFDYLYPVNPIYGKPFLTSDGGLLRNKCFGLPC